MNATFPCTSSRMSLSEGYLRTDLISEVIKNKEFNLGYPQASRFKFTQHLEIVYRVNAQSVQ